MAKESKFSMAKLVNEIPCPDELLEAKDNYVKMEEILDKDIDIKAFVFMVSKDLTKYNQNNEKSVHFLFEMDGKVYRTATHSKRIVKGFEALLKATGTNVLELPVATKLVLKELESGRQMYDFAF